MRRRQLAKVTHVLLGKRTEVFQRVAAADIPDELCLSLRTPDRTLDLQCQSRFHRDRWAEALQYGVEMAKATAHTSWLEKQRRKSALRHSASVPALPQLEDTPAIPSLLPAARLPTESKHGPTQSSSSRREVSWSASNSYDADGPLDSALPNAAGNINADESKAQARHRRFSHARRKSESKPMDDVQARMFHQNLKRQQYVQRALATTYGRQSRSGSTRQLLTRSVSSEDTTARTAAQPRRRASMGHSLSTPIDTEHAQSHTFPQRKVAPCTPLRSIRESYVKMAKHMKREASNGRPVSKSLSLHSLAPGTDSPRDHSRSMPYPDAAEAEFSTTECSVSEAPPLPPMTMPSAHS